MLPRFIFGLALGALLLTGCGSTVAPTVEPISSSTPPSTLPAATASASAVASTPSAVAQTSRPAAPPATGKVIAIAADGDHTCALNSGGGVKCWGRSDSGQLGNGSVTYWDGGTTTSSTPKYVVGLTSGIMTIAVGTNYTCALTSGGGVKCWPLDMHGTVGDVAGLTSGATAITAGGDLYGGACVLTSAGGVKCWGASYYTAPVDVAGLTSGVAAIAPGSGNYGGCALTSAGGVKCWGDNGAAPMATDGLPSSSGAIAIAPLSEARGGCAIASGGGITCWGNPLSQVIDVAGVSGITAIAFGYHYMCVLTSGGGVKCLGLNAWGELGNGSDKSSSTLTNVVGLTSGVTAIAAGDKSTCALTSGGGVKCWGSGYGTTPTNVVGLTSGITAITAGNGYMCALTSGGGVKCWGSGYGPAPVDVTGL